MYFKIIHHKPLQIRKHLWIQFFNISDSPRELKYEFDHNGYPLPFNPLSRRQIVTYNILSNRNATQKRISISSGEVLCNLDNSKSPLTFYDNSYNDIDNGIRGQKRPTLPEIITGLDGVYEVLKKWMQNAKYNPVPKNIKQHSVQNQKHSVKPNLNVKVHLSRLAINFLVKSVNQTITALQSTSPKAYHMYGKTLMNLEYQLHHNYKLYQLPSKDWKRMIDELNFGIDWSNFSQKSLKMRDGVTHKINKAIGD